MPLTVRDSRSSISTDPLRNFKFIVNIFHNVSDQNNQQVAMSRLGFMTVGGLSMENDMIAYRQGGFNSTALPLSAPVLTTSGWKRMGNVQVGDQVVDPRGEDSKVVGVYPAGVKDTYEVTLQDGSKATACYGHLWEFTSDGKMFTLSTLGMKDCVEGGTRVLLPKVNPVKFDVARELPLDPYEVGLDLSHQSATDVISEEYMFAELEQRRELLRGIKDGDPASKLHGDARALELSLGMRTEDECRVVSVEYVGKEDVQCIEVSASSHLFISHDFVPSHNTQKLPGQTNFPPLSFSRGMICGQPDEYLWFKEVFSVVSGAGSGPNPTNGAGLNVGDFRADIEIYVMQHPWTKSQEVPVKAKYHVFNAWPQSISWSDLDAGGNGLIMEGMVVQHEGFGLVYASDATNADVMSVATY